ncbi:MAG: bifunctional glutamate N-acetyltransferase/amino-acid acetyltransferase ArgJ [Coriobacteriia bacterium]|nr:bifunctional glutamate N-acetyltransferase/amino-acid acetyltransferase ArgJ [Coriobacteriia bacterium]
METYTDSALEPVAGGVLAPSGFLASGVAAGLKKGGKLDVALVAASRSVPAAAVFTTSSMAAAPVVVSRQNLAAGVARAVVINAGNANACTGERGMTDARAMVAATASALSCEPHEIVVASTGVIGVQLPLAVVEAGIAEAAAGLSGGASAASDAAAAIMTTDTSAKEAAVAVTVGERTYRVGGMAKGSGMIMPNMATMLGFITTDAPLTTEACRSMLSSAAGVTFNRITVDGDTSTNDMVLLMASGEAGGSEIGPHSPEYAAILGAVTHVCRELSHMIVRDGEGATHFVTVTVRGALSDADADAAARSIANSPLFKTAIFGADANWGRVAMAVGKSAATVDPDRLEIEFAGITTCRDGMAVPFSEDEAAAALALPEVDVVVDLHLGSAEATVWTCDLSYEYVRINGEYRS